jgi:D-sedoheptulose 7-phosphate isomerase
VADVAASVRMKAAEVGALRERTLTEGADALAAAAGALRKSFARGGRLLVLGNGGSATDAMDVAADFRHPPPGMGAPRPVLDLTEDAAILTALANDIGVENIFARQVIAHGRTGDALLAISTSGGSGNVLAALAEARRRGMVTIALVGYDGGEIAAGALADHVIVTRSQHIPRIQEAQASAYHVLRELVG